MSDKKEQNTIKISVRVSKYELEYLKKRLGMSTSDVVNMAIGRYQLSEYMNECKEKRELKEEWDKKNGYK